MTLGQNIQSLRKNAGLSQEALGEALGVSRQAVSKWESDSAIPELDTLIAMSRLFQTTLGALLLIEPSENAAPQEKPEEDRAAYAAEEPAQTSGDRAADRLEALLEQYAAQNQQQKQRQKKHRLLAAAVAALVLLGGSMHTAARFRELQQSLRQLEGRMSVLSSSVDRQINDITGCISDLLEEQDNILADSSTELTGVDIANGAVLYDLSATLKTFNTASTGRFLLRYTDDAGQTQTVESDICQGPVFSAQVRLPYNGHTEVLLLVDDPDGQQRTQKMTTIYDAAEAYYRLSGSASMSYTAHAADDRSLRLVLYGSYTIWQPDLPAKLGMPLSVAEVKAEVYHNDILVQTVDLTPDNSALEENGKDTDTTAPTQAPTAAAAGEGADYVFPAPLELTLAVHPGDVLKTIFSFTDNYGRVSYDISGFDKVIRITEGKNGLEINAAELTEDMLPEGPAAAY